MDMQIATSLTMGNGIFSAAQELALRGRRIPISEQDADRSQTGTLVQSSREDFESANENQIIPDLGQINLTFDRRLQFVLDQESSEITVKVIDRETDTVIKVLPPEELQRLHNGMRETIGVLFDRTI